MLVHGFIKQRPRLNDYVMSRLGGVFEFGIVPDRTEVLNQRAAVINIEQLQASANGQDRNILFDGLVEDVEFDGIAFIVGRIGFRLSCLVIALRVHVGTAHQQQAVHTIQMGRRVGEMSMRIESDLGEGCEVGLDFCGVAERNDDFFGAGVRHDNGILFQW